MLDEDTSALKEFVPGTCSRQVVSKWFSVVLTCRHEGRNMSFRKWVTRDAPEKKFLASLHCLLKVIWYKSILRRLVHIQSWLLAPVAPVQLILRMLNALQSAIVQKISSVTWFTARSATTVLTARLICYSPEQVRYWAVAINKDQFYLKILFLINAYDKQHLLSLH